MMIMMSGTKVFNKSAKRNFHQRESHDDEEDDNEIATIYYYSGKEIIKVRQGTPLHTFKEIYKTTKEKQQFGALYHHGLGSSTFALYSAP